MREAVIVASSRTPLAKSHRGSFKDTRPDDLAAHAIRHVLAKAPSLDPGEVEDVILGCGQPHQSQGHNVARVAALRAGLPVTTAGLTVNRFCASGLQAIAQAAHMISAEGADVVIGGGVESISLITRDSSPNPVVQQQHPGVYMVMGETAEVVAKKYGISREAQDEYALISQQRTARAQQEGFFDGEIAPFGALGKDECDRPETTIEALRTLPPVFDTTSGTGSVTAGNSSQLSDGASATLVMSTARANALNLKPLLVFRGYAVSGCAPDEMGIGPVFAVPKLLKHAGVKAADIDVWELNEAFASQVIYCRDTLGIPMETMNPNGGSIAIGHPFGMTGSRLVGTIANEMARRRARYGVVTMCVGGGQGVAALFESVGMKKIAFALVVISLQSPVFSQSPSPEPRVPKQFAITHVTVIDTDKGVASVDMTVVIRGDRIASVDKRPAPAGARVLKGRGKFLIPGLWDMHTHLTDSRASALPVLAATGVTYVRDAGNGNLAEIDAWRGQVAAGEILGPTIFRAGPTLNGQESKYHIVIANAADARMAARTLQKVGVDFLKTHRRTSRDAYFALADEAKKIGIPLIGHVPMTVTPAEASDAGQQTIEHVETLFEGTFATAHNGQVTAAGMAAWRASPESKALFETFVRNGTVVDPTLVASGALARSLNSLNEDPRMRYVAKSARQRREEALAGIPGTLRTDMPPQVMEREAVTLQMQRAGVTLVTGTDASFLHPPGFSLHDELDLLADAGLTPAEILRAATINCAKLFPLLDAGVVAAGKRADLVLLNANPLSDIHNAHDIYAVVLRGRVLNRATLDRALAEAVRLAATQ